MRIYSKKEGEKGKLSFTSIFWILSFCMVFITGVIGCFISPPLSKDKDNVQTILIKCIWAHKFYFMPGLLVPLLAISLGSFLGIFSSKAMKVSGMINFFFLSITDAIESLPKYPTIILAIILMPECIRNLWGIMLILGFLNSSKISRLIKSKIDSLEKMEYIEFADSIGINRWRLIYKHILLYNCLPLLITQIFFQMCEVILVEIGLAVIGPEEYCGFNFGMITTDDTFGNMLMAGRNNIMAGVTNIVAGVTNIVAEVRNMGPGSMWIFLIPLGVVLFNILMYLNLAKIIEEKIYKKRKI
ncbi:MAG: ABC transporter permease subunit [bacterium]